MSKTKPKKSTALVVRGAQRGSKTRQQLAQLKKRARRAGVIEVGTITRRKGDHPDVGISHFPAAPADQGVLGEEAALGALGLIEIKLTAKEEAVLARSVPVEQVLIKPTGQPYLSHPTYTKWFNDAFGRLGWAIVPRAKPRYADTTQGDSPRGTISCPYVLYIHGKPAAFAMGEQEYHESNKEQTYGDAYEATVASALRRCAKRLGVGLELWDKTWLQTFIDKNCVKVWCGEEKKPRWRRRIDPPFWNERTARGQEEQTKVRHEARRPPAAGHDGSGNQKITMGTRDKPGQVQRLWVIIRNSGRAELAVREWLKGRYGYESTQDILRKDYEEICRLIEDPVVQLDPRAREPGEEG